MLRHQIKTILEPVRSAGRRFLGLPSMDEQQFVSLRGCVYRAVQFTTRNYIVGDYLEFGVWRGDSFVKAYHALHKFRSEHIAWLDKRPTHKSESGKSASGFERWKTRRPRFFAFDSFEGLPKSNEDQLPEEWVEGGYACAENDFLKNVAADGVDLKDVITVRGFYDQTLNHATRKKYHLDRAAIVHIDCDYYESTITVLDFVTDLLSQGSVIIFDDWFYNQGRPDLGEQRACREWLARNPQIELIEYWRDIHSICFIVNYKSPQAVN